MDDLLRAEMVQLLAAELDGAATLETHTRLEQLLDTSASARRFYIDHVDLHANLLWERRGFDCTAPGLLTNGLPTATGQLEADLATDRRMMGRGAADPSSAESTKPAGRQELPRQSQSPRLGFLGGIWDAVQSSSWTVGLLLAGGLAGYFLVMFALIPLARLAQSRRPVALLPPTPARATSRGGAVVGTLTFDSTATWSGERKMDAHARVGQLYLLESGLASLTLTSGTQMVFEGPAAWTFDSNAWLRFDAGRLAAYVPPRAVGFTVATPTAEVRDLGTEFNLDVGPDGETAVYVVTGRVALKGGGQRSAPADAARPVANTVQVVAGDAVRVTAPGAVQTIPFDPGRLASTRTALKTLLRGPKSNSWDFPPERPILLGNLFDDRPHVSLVEAMRTDTFGEDADMNDLGVERVIAGGDAVREIAPRIRFDFSNLGWESYGQPYVTNDSWRLDNNPASSRGIRVTGTQLQSKDRVEDGICQTGNTFITFQLDDLRAAGRLQGKGFEFVCERVGLNDPWVGLNQTSMHVAALVSTPTGIHRAFVNGTRVTVVDRNGQWSVDSPIGEPLREKTPPVSFRVPIDPTDKYLTLVSTTAGDGPSGDQPAWINARLEVRP